MRCMGDISLILVNLAWAFYGPPGGRGDIFSQQLMQAGVLFFFPLNKSVTGNDFQDELEQLEVKHDSVNLVRFIWRIH